VKQIRVLARENHSISDDTNEVVDLLIRNGIPAHNGQEEQEYGVVWVH
jgi:hypothetical protein